jgi:hypothetical protein
MLLGSPLVELARCDRGMLQKCDRTGDGAGTSITGDLACRVRQLRADGKGWFEVIELSPCSVKRLMEVRFNKLLIFICRCNRSQNQFLSLLILLIHWFPGSAWEPDKIILPEYRERQCRIQLITAGHGTAVSSTRSTAGSLRTVFADRRLRLLFFTPQAGRASGRHPEPGTGCVNR